MFNIGISRDAQLLVVCTGTPTYADFIALIHLLADVSRRENWQTLLVDLSSVPPTFSDDERARLGAYAGSALVGRHVALVVPAPERFTGVQASARQNGGTVRYFTDHHSAIEWLGAARSGRTA